MFRQNEVCYEFIYSRQGRAVYFSHLDVVEIILRAIRRSDMPYKISQGFNPRPKVSFGPPLPLGHASVCEYFRVLLYDEINPQLEQEKLNTLLPEGFKILKCNKADTKHYDGSIIQYKIYIYSDGTEAFNKYFEFVTSDKVVVEIANKNNSSTIYDIKCMIVDVSKQKFNQNCPDNESELINLIANNNDLHKNQLYNFNSNNGFYNVIMITLKQESKMPSIGKAVNGIVNKYQDLREYIKKVERYRFLK